MPISNFSHSAIATSAAARSAVRERIAKLTLALDELQRTWSQRVRERRTLHGSPVQGLEQLDLEIVLLERMFWQRSCQRRRLRLLRDSYRYPVLTLPAEIASTIFVQCLPRYPDHPPAIVGPLKYQFPWSLLEVCHRWREIALTTPSLWSSVRLDLFNSDQPLHALQLRLFHVFMQRSRHHPLTITIFSMTQEVDAAFVTPLAQAISPHASRIRALRIDLPSAHLGCLTGPTPLLHSLAVDPAEFPPVWTQTSEESRQTLFPNAPNLKELDLSYSFNPFRFTLPWSQITSLTATLPCDGAAEILRHSPLLEVCSIHVRDSDTDMPAISAIPPLPLLRSLRLHRWADKHDGQGPSLQQFFSLLALPALQTLVVSQHFLGDDPVATIRRLRRRGAPDHIAVHEAWTDDRVFETAFPDSEISLQCR